MHNGPQQANQTSQLISISASPQSMLALEQDPLVAIATANPSDQFTVLKNKIADYVNDKISAEVLVADLTPGNIRWRVTAGPFTGVTILWLLAYAAFKGKFQAVKLLWENWEGKNFNIADFHNEPQGGPFKGTTVFHLLAAASKHDKGALLQDIFKKKKDALYPIHFLACAQEGPLQGTNPLWLLADRMQSQLVMFLWGKFGDEISLAELRRPLNNGPYKGSSLLHSFLRVSPTVFNAIWQKWGNHFTLEEFRRSQYEGGTLLWATSCNQTIWDRWKNELTLADFREAPKAVWGRGWTLLSEVIFMKHIAVFQAIWSKWENQITFEDIRKPVEHGPHKGKSILWSLARELDFFDVRGYMPLISAIWQKWWEQITLEDLRRPVAEDVTLLGALANAARCGHTEFFTAIWTKFHDHITPEELSQSVQSGPKKGLSTLELLLHANHPVLDILLAQMPNLYINPEKEVNPVLWVTPKFKQRPDYELIIKPLIMARNALFSSLNDAWNKAKTSFNYQNYLALKAQAQQALGKGYLNAYYDLGELCEAMGLVEEACEAYSHVPVNSIHFIRINEKLALSWLAKATDAATPSDYRAVYLDKALYNALRCPQADTRKMLILRIANCYCAEGSQDVKLRIKISEELLSLMVEGRSTSWCFRWFNYLKEEQQLKEQAHLLQTSIAKKKDKLQWYQQLKNRLVGSTIPAVSVVTTLPTPAHSAAVEDKLSASGTITTSSVTSTVSLTQNEFSQTCQKIAEYDKGSLTIAELMTFLSPEKLRLTGRSGAYEGKSILWLLACALYNGKPEAFNAVWVKWQNKIKLEDLLKQVKGWSVLGLLAQSFRNNKTNTFYSVWQKWVDHIPIEVLLERPVLKDNTQDNSILLKLVLTPIRDGLNLFNLVWEKWKSHIPLNTLREKDPSGGNLLWLMARRGEQGLQELFSSMPEVFNEEDLATKPNSTTSPLPTLKEILQQRADWKSKIEPLLMAKQELMEAKQINKLDQSKLLAAIKNAHAKGYVHAYLDVGTFLAENNLLKMALQLAFVCPYTTDRIKLIRLAALKYMKDLPNATQVDEVISETMIEGMHLKKCANWCFKLFDEIKAILISKQNVEQQEADLQALKVKIEMIKKDLTALTPAVGEVLASKLNEAMLPPVSTEVKVEDALVPPLRFTTSTTTVSVVATLPETHVTEPPRPKNV